MGRVDPDGKEDKHNVFNKNKIFQVEEEEAKEGRKRRKILRGEEKQSQ